MPRLSQCWAHRTLCMPREAWADSTNRDPCAQESVYAGEYFQRVPRLSRMHTLLDRPNSPEQPIIEYCYRESSIHCPFPHSKEQPFAVRQSADKYLFD